MKSQSREQRALFREQLSQLPESFSFVAFSQSCRELLLRELFFREQRAESFFSESRELLLREQRASSQRAESREQRAESRELRAENREQKAESRKQRAEGVDRICKNGFQSVTMAAQIGHSYHSEPQRATQVSRNVLIAC